LTIGVVLKLLDEYDQYAVALIIVGAAFKLAHIIGIIRNKSYKPGLELAVLALGLFLFFFGLYVCHIESIARNFIIAGVIFKFIFVILFIRKLEK